VKIIKIFDKNNFNEKRNNVIIGEKLFNNIDNEKENKDYILLNDIVNNITNKILIMTRPIILKINI